MDSHVVVTCPHCGFNRKIAPGVIPPGTTRANCPKCRQQFTLSPDTMVTHSDDFTPPPAREVRTESPAVPTEAKKPSSRPRTLTFSFNGTATDYFGIWIVNMLLKLLTAGFYTAWAKVRKRRFFYGSTTLNGESFEYLADPMALFKGWLIGVGAFLIYMIANRISPVLSIVIGIAFFLVIPWLVVRSRMFNSRNSSYRNIHFGFYPDYRKAYLVYAWLPLLTPFTLGLIAPYTIYRQRKFMVENTSYGMTPFSFTATAGDFYKLIGKIILLFLAVMAVISLITFSLGGHELIGAAKTTGNIKGNLSALAMLPMLSFALIYFFVGIYAQTALNNLTWNSTIVGDNNFKSSLRTRDMMWLYVSSALAIVLSLGFLTPWATVRLARYRFGQLALKTTGDLDGFLTAAREPEIGAAGEEIGDIFGITVDVGL